MTPCTLVLGWPSPVAVEVAGRLAQRGDQVTVLGPEGSSPSLPGLEFLVGDPAAIDFGLSGEEYLRLVRRTSRAVCASERLTGVREFERAPALRIAGELLEFVEAGGAPCGLTFHSSLLALGAPARPVLEGELDVGQSFFSKYEESLAVAERIVRRTGARVPLMVVRSAPISGRETGELFPEAPLARLARRIQVSNPLSEVAFRDEPVRFECVEPVADLLLRLADACVPRTVHLADRVPVSDRSLVRFLINYYHGDPFPRTVSVPFRMRLSLPDVVAAHSVSGWRSRFDLSEAEAVCPDLLARDPLQRLKNFFPAQVTTSSDTQEGPTTAVDEAPLGVPPRSVSRGESREEER